MSLTAQTRRRIETIAREMDTPIEEIMRSFKVIGPDRVTVKNIVDHERRGRK